MYKIIKYLQYLKIGKRKNEFILIKKYIIYTICNINTLNPFVSYFYKINTNSLHS